ncbi:adenylosuccinate lyase family protein [Bacteroidota bacterium]
MPSSIIDSNYYRDMFGTAAMRQVFSDERRILAWFETEVALARAEAKVGIIPLKVAEQIAIAAKPKNLNLNAMKAEFDNIGFPILPFVHQLTKACDPEAARWVHYGATTQDILDTAYVLQMRDGIKLIEADMNGIVEALAYLARTHRDTVMPGRTFQQLAAPITFGYKVAVWLDEIMRHRDRIHELKPRLLVGQCAGAVGTFATLGNRGLDVQREMMNLLGLGVPNITWHTARDRWAELISLFGMITASFGKIATEIAILMRSEIGEVSEPFKKGRGASTTLPQKRNPITCESIIAIAHRMRETVGSQLTAMIQEHERSVGPMHLEWIVIPEAFVLLSGSLKNSRFILENLVVDKNKMRMNLELEGGLIMSEAVMMGLAPKVGKKKAHDIIYNAAGQANDEGITLREALLSDEDVKSILSEKEIDALIDPSNYTGSAGEMVDAVLSKLKK